MVRDMERTLICGGGEVGRGLYEVLSAHYPTELFDIAVNETVPIVSIKWLHICFPYSENFVKYVRQYMRIVKPQYCVIHSTVPVGTTHKCGKNVWHSPIRGLHPDLALGIKTFVKYIGGTYNYEVLEYFSKTGIQVYHTAQPETTELLKLLDTTIYSVNIVACKEAKKLCDKYGANFDVAYTSAQKTYNVGYKKLDKSQYVRPVLKYKEGPIGGHCCINNAILLGEDLGKMVVSFNEKYKLQKEST
jgi:UDP-N-acetyl-D-mannosaminuronate dehydrogenase